MKNDLAIFEGHQIRRVYDEKTETWWFSFVDIIQVLTQQPDYKHAQNYWKVLKHRLKKEGSQLVTNCNQLKMPAADGKSYRTDVATAETLLRLVQSVPSPRAEPIKLWLAKVGYERMHPADRGERGGDRHGGKQGCCQNWRAHREKGSSGTGSKNRTQSGFPGKLFSPVQTSQKNRVNEAETRAEHSANNQSVLL